MSKYDELKNDISKLTDLVYETNQKYQDDINKLHNELDKLQKDLKTKIVKEFKNVQVDVRLNEYDIDIMINGNGVLHHSYGRTEFKNITRELKNKIINMYNELYGEVKKTNFENQCASDKISLSNDALDSLMYAYSGMQFKKNSY